MSPKKLKNCLLLKKLRLFFGGTADILILSDKKKGENYGYWYGTTTR